MAVVNSRYKRIVVAMGSQMGKTEFCFNVIGHRLDIAPVPTIFIFPTQRLAESVSQSRFMKVIRSSASLWSKLAKGRLNKITEKYIAGVRLSFAWSSSSVQLCSHPAGLVVLDERDRMENDVEGEGDPVLLVAARTTTYPDAKLVITSTPTLQGLSPIWSLWEQGTRQKWHVSCPLCGHYILPCLQNFGWGNTEDPAKVQEAYLVCTNCHAHIPDLWRTKMDGVFLAVGQEVRDGVIIGAVKETNTASFWVSGLCSPWRSYHEAAVQYLEAKKQNDPTQLQACINTVFGECFQNRGEAPPWRDIFETLRANYETNTIPDGVIGITCGADVQKDAIYFAIRGWGRDERSWLLKYGIIYGETDNEETWQKFEKLLRTPIDGKLPIRLLCIDAGYRSHFVYAFCKELPGFALPCKGQKKQSAPISASSIEISFQGRRFKGGMKLFHIDDGYFKSLLYSKLHGQNWVLPKNVDEEYCRQLVAEEMVVDRSGKLSWVQNYQHNHYLDAEKLNLVAAAILQIDMLEKKESERKIVSEGIDIYA